MCECLLKQAERSRRTDPFLVSDLGRLVAVPIPDSVAVLESEVGIYFSQISVMHCCIVD